MIKDKKRKNNTLINYHTDSDSCTWGVPAVRRAVCCSLVLQERARIRETEIWLLVERTVRFTRWFTTVRSAYTAWWEQQSVKGQISRLNIFFWGKAVCFPDIFVYIGTVLKAIQYQVPPYRYGQGCRSRPEPPFLAGAGAGFLVRLRLLLLLLLTGL